jgi:hypothetical protein
MSACKLTSVEEIPKRETGSLQGTGEGKRKDEFRSRRFGRSQRVPHKPEEHKDDPAEKFEMVFVPEGRRKNGPCGLVARKYSECYRGVYDAKELECDIGRITRGGSTRPKFGKKRKRGSLQLRVACYEHCRNDSALVF